MKQKLETLQRESQATYLSDEERQAMRESLLSYINKNPAPGTVSHKSATAGIISQYAFKFSLFFACVLSAAGISLAAERAVPGNFLYPVKTHINEKVRGALSLTTQTKAHNEVYLAARRLVEAEVLEHQSKLVGSIKEALSKDFMTHIANAGGYIKALSAENNTEAAFQTNLELMAAVEGHQPIMAVLNAATTASTTDEH
jgi:hypothetical protein